MIKLFSINLITGWIINNGTKRRGEIFGANYAKLKILCIFFFVKTRVSLSKFNVENKFCFHFFLMP